MQSSASIPPLAGCPSFSRRLLRKEGRWTKHRNLSAQSRGSNMEAVLATRTRLFKRRGDPSDGFVFAQPVSWVLTRTQQKKAQQRCGSRAGAEWPAYDGANCPAKMPHADEGAKLAWHGRGRMVRLQRAVVVVAAGEAAIMVYGSACTCSMS